jgi:hypothetical protein
MDGFALHEAMYVRVADEKEALIRGAINLHMLTGCSNNVGHVSAEKNADHVIRLGVGGHEVSVSSLGDDETTSQVASVTKSSISSNLRTTPIAYCLPLTCLLESVAEATRFLLY